jgi:CubicO group peptidase (beta-lactamase class C family)
MLATITALGGLLVYGVACTATAQHDPASLVAELDARIPAVVAAGNLPSVQVAVVHADQVVWSKTFGENTSIDHVYMNGSVQKVLTAIAVLQLVERGLVDLDEDVGSYLPFEVRHPRFVDTPITVRMLLAHRSGLGTVPHQFGWDTESTFSPAFRAPAPDHLVAMSLEEYLAASLIPTGSNYDEEAWDFEPGRGYGYSNSAYLLLRYLIDRVTGQRYSDYLHDNVFVPLGMTNSGFNTDEFSGRHTMPHTRVDGENVELPIWNGRSLLMRTTADDMAQLALALMSDGQLGDHRVLQPATVELMKQITSRFRGRARAGGDIPSRGAGMGLWVFRDGWYGFGGSTPGYQSLWRFNPTKQVGFVILTNVNGILGGDYDSARGDIYAVQNELLSILE